MSAVPDTMYMHVHLHVHVHGGELCKPTCQLDVDLYDLAAGVGAHDRARCVATAGLVLVRPLVGVATDAALAAILLPLNLQPAPDHRVLIVYNNRRSQLKQQTT